MTSVTEEKDIDKDFDEDNEEEQPSEDPAEGDADDAGGSQADESPDAKNARLERMLDRHQKKFGLGKYAKSESPSEKSNELNEGQLALLVAKGYDHPDDAKLVQGAMKSLGLSLSEVLNDTFVQGKLKEAQEFRKSQAASPTSKRTGESARSEVEYWLQKGGLPENTPENQKLRRDVVNARLKNQTDNRKFTDTPVVK